MKEYYLLISSNKIHKISHKDLSMINLEDLHTVCNLYKVIYTDLWI